MKRLLTGVVVFGLTAAMAAGDAYGQRGGRGGARGASAAGRSGAGSHVAPGRATERPGGAGASAFQGRPVGQRPVPPGRRPDSSALGQFLGLDRAAAQQPRPGREAVSHWAESANPPFTAAWYADHPNAWHATHPHADVFVAATAVGVTGWLAAPTVVSAGASSGGTVEYVAADAVSSDTSAPTDQASSEAAATADDAQWMPLGVFALKPSDQPKARLVLQMAVRRDGVLRGSQFDTTSQEVANVVGAIDKQTLRATWRLEGDHPESFETALAELTKAEGNLTVRLPEGKQESWKAIQISR